jgi:diguanylate cyclase (GGDEF)-like protein/PAS domain S-box-containing protein
MPNSPFASLRIRTTVVLTAIFTAMGLACVFVAGSIISDRVSGFERELAAANVRRARNALQQDMSRLDALLKDWAWWDDTYAFMAEPTQGFIASNVTPDVFRNQRLSAMIFVSDAGKILHASFMDSESGEFGAPVAGLMRFVLDPAQARSAGNEAGGNTAVAHIDGKLWIAGSKTVLTSQESGPSRGWLWMIQELDTPYMHELKRRTELDLRLTAVSGGGLPEAMSSLRGNEGAFDRAVVAAEQKRIWSGLLIPDAAGGEPVAMIVSAPRELAVYVSSAMRNSLAVVIVFGVVGFFAGLVYLDRSILSRLSELSRRVVRDAPGVQVCAQDGRCDEIDRLGLLTDAAFLSIRENERFLSEVLAALKVGVMLVRKRDRVIVSANRYACELIDKPEEEIVGKTCHRFVCPMEAGTCPVLDLGQVCDNSRRVLIRAGGEHIDILKSATSVTRGGEDFLLETFLDIREMERTRRLLEESEERYRAIFMNTGTPGILINEDTTIAVANTEFLHLVGAREEEVARHPSWTRFFVEDDARRMVNYHDLRRQDRDAAPRSYEARLVDSSGGMHFVRVTVALIPHTRQSIAFFLDITDMRRAEAKLQELAFTDALTGLPNRLSAMDRLTRTLESLRPHSGSLAVLLLDLDDFKIVNDSWGHAAGDIVLMEVGQRLASVLTTSELVGRLGGDEFIIVSAVGAGEEDWADLASRLIGTLSRPFGLEDSEIHLGVSVGIAVYPRDGETAGQLVRCADLAMYQSKSSGKSMFQFHSPELTRSVQQRMEIERELRLALDAGEIEAFYQPVIDLESGRIVGAEALARWRKPDGRLVSPAAFVPVAEQTNLITDIDLAVLSQACSRTRVWIEAGFGDLRVSCNISARHFQRGKLIADVRRVLDASGLPASRLTLEVTETVYMENIDQTRDILDSLRGLGVSTALDDFGTGYSSLSYVRSLHFDVLKIDRAFVKNLPDESSLALVRAMLGIADSLGITPLAEGVENTGQFELLRSLGCRYGQGYLFSPPVPADQFRDMLARQDMAG